MTAITVHFTAEGQPVVPDLGSATYSIRGQDGALLLTDEPITVPTNATSVTVPIDSQYENRALDFEKRTVIFRWRKGTIEYTKTVIYRLTKFLNITVTPDHVRSYLGIEPQELRDEEIDLVTAYINVENTLTSAKLDVHLSAGGQEELTANRAILLTACLGVLPSLRLRIAKERADGNITWSRFDVKDFSDLEAAIIAELGSIFTDLKEEPTAEYTLIVFSQNTDAITGA